MPKKIIKKKKLKLFSILLFLVIVVLLYFIIKAVLTFKIQNIYIHNTCRLNDEYVMELADINDYPSFVLNFSWNVEKKLNSSPYIKSSSVKKGFLGVLDIYIEESKVLFYKEYDKKYVLDNFVELDEIIYDVSTVRVINFVPDTVYDKFLTKFSKIDEEVRDKISQIKYDPSEYDDSRFLFYMIDGNYVYVNLTKLDSINYYNEIYPTLEGKKGTLYLDSGNHFQAF